MRPYLAVLSVFAGATLCGTLSASAEPRPVAGFRLGSAAAPFGYATVIADFNADGAPDFAVADKEGPGTSHRYTLEFVVSGEAPYAIHFSSPQPALTLAVADVDADHDPDLLLSAPITEERVAVWLNDGRGHFARASDIGPTAHRTSRDAIRPPGGSRSASLNALIPTRTGAQLDTRTAPPPSPATSTCSAAADRFIPTADRSAPSQLRGPPPTTQS